MTTIKQKIMVLATMMVMLVSSMVSAYGPEYWNGDTNYPRAYGKENVTWYVDLSSAYKVEDENYNITLKYNVVTTYDNSDKTEVDTYTMFLKNCEDGYESYAVNPDGSMFRISSKNAWQATLYRSLVLVQMRLHIKG